MVARYENYSIITIRPADEPVGKEDEMTASFAMLNAMLVFRSEERLTAAEIPETEWIRKWLS